MLDPENQCAWYKYRPIRRPNSIPAGQGQNPGPLRKKEGGVQRQMVQFRLTDPEPLLFQNEALLLDGEIVPFVTSGNYGQGRSFGGYRRQYREIGGIWRAAPGDDDNYVYAIALL